jgi:hypothetical protein
MAVRWQTTDVEGEADGLMTYDRQVVTYDGEKLARRHRRTSRRAGRPVVIPALGAAGREPSLPGTQADAAGVESGVGAKPSWQPPVAWL